MSKVMFQFRDRGRLPTLDDVCTRFGLRPDEVDSQFGVIPTDSDAGLYVVLVHASAQERIKEKLKTMGADADPAVGVFANPSINIERPNKN